MDVIPFGMCEDGATYRGKGPGHLDSLELRYVNILGQRARRIIVAIPTSRMCGEACGCPCKGRCTKVEIDRIILWMLEVCASGKRPANRHDHFAFTEQHRRDNRNKVFVTEEVSEHGVRFVLLEYRADWVQLSKGLGFPSHGSLNFCPKCKVPREQAHDYEESFAWPCRTHESYLHDAAQVTIVVVVSRQTFSRILEVLKFDWRRNGMHGRIVGRQLQVMDLKRGVSTTLLANDRLEAAGDIRDIHCDNCSLLPDPCTIVFFRKRVGVFLKFIPLLLSAPFFKFEYILLDILHSLDLGVTARLVAYCIVLLLKHGKYGNADNRTGFLQGLRSFNRSMRVYASGERKRCRRQLKGSFTCFNTITLSMLGLKKSLNARPMMKGRGIEVRHILPFCIHELRPQTSSIANSRLLLTSMTSLKCAYDIMERNGYELPPDVCDELEHHLKQCGKNARDGQVPLLPKFHLLPHLGAQCRVSGNLRHSAMLEDESMNADSVRMAARSHSRDFMERLLAQQQLLLDIEQELLDFRIKG